MLTPSLLRAQNDGFAGTAYTFYPLPPSQTQSRPLLPSMHAAGSRWDRFDFPWPLFEPSPGVWNWWEIQDDLVNDVSDAGYNILGILLWTPNWAANGPCAATYQHHLRLPSFGHRRAYELPLWTQNAQNAPCSTRPPIGLSEPWNDWTTEDGDPINYWGRFIYTVASRYRSAISHWEVWNEPDLPWFWTGTPAEYARLLKVAYQAIKSACPECTVLFGGIVFYANPDFYRQALDALRSDPEAPAHNHFFDAFAIHLYSRSSAIVDITQIVRNDLRTRSLDRPIWLTETGVPAWDDTLVNPDAAPYIWSARQHEVASFVLQSYANARLTGIQRYIFFRAHDDWCDKNRDGDCADPGVDYGMVEMFGLVRDDLSARPAYTAFQLATTFLISPTWVSYWNYSSGGRRVSFWGTPHGKVSVFWNTAPSASIVTYSAAVPTATLVHQSGVSQTLHAFGGAYQLSLPGATANNGLNPSDYIIGGETFLLIERDTEAPLAQLITVTFSAPLTYTVSWTGTDAASGVWSYDVQHRQSNILSWTAWLTRTTQTAASFRAPYPSRWCFRVRAWDRVGNISAWTPARCAAPAQNVHLLIHSIFGDADGDGIHDADEMLVTSLIQVRDRESSEVVTSTTATSWIATLALPLGEYALEVFPQVSGWLPYVVPISVTTDKHTLEFTAALAARRADVFIPLVKR